MYGSLIKLDSKKLQIHIANLQDKPEYIPQLAKWHHKEWASLNPGQTLQDRIDKMQDYLGNNFMPSMFIAEYNDQLLGSAAVVEHDMITRKELSPWLASVYIVPEFRNQGIGNKLVQYVTKQTNKHEIETLFLFTPDKVSFYQSLGWLVMEETTYHCERVTIMQKQLASLK